MTRASTAVHRLNRAVALAFAVVAVFAVMPAASGSSAGVLGALAPQAAQAASPASCVAIGRNLVGFAAVRNPWYAFNALRRVPGCGDFNAGAICWASQQWWGGGARYLVRLATWGRYDRC